MEKHYERQVHLFNMGYVLDLGKSQWALKKKNQDFMCSVPL